MTNDLSKKMKEEILNTHRTTIYKRIEKLINKKLEYIQEYYKTAEMYTPDYKKYKMEIILLLNSINKELDKTCEKIKTQKENKKEHNRKTLLNSWLKNKIHYNEYKDI